MSLFEPTPIPVYSGVRARPFADVRDDLAAALVEPVRWRATMRALADAHPRAFVDLGPGEVLGAPDPAEPPRGTGHRPRHAHRGLARRSPAPDAGTATSTTGADPMTGQAGILGVGSALPPLRVHSDEIARRIGVDSGWIERRTGIRERRRAAPGERVSTLAAIAANAALADAGLSADALDAVLVATVTADEIMPAAAPIVAHEIGRATPAPPMSGPRAPDRSRRSRSRPR